MSASKLADLANRILRSSPVDKGEQERILRLLEEIRGSLGLSNNRTTVEYLDAAALLIAYLAQMGSIGGSEIRTVGARLIETASRVVDGDAAAAPPTAVIAEATNVVGSALDSSFLAQRGNAVEQETSGQPGTAPMTGQILHSEPPRTSAQAANDHVISDTLLGEIMVRMAVV